MENIAIEKEKVRTLIRERLRSLSSSQKREESKILTSLLVNYIQQHCTEGSLIASFAGLKSEPDLRDLHTLLPSYRIAYPRCSEGHQMDFYEVNDIHQQLEKGYYGIEEPNTQKTSIIEPQNIDLIIVPSLAYTSSGHRLGKGGGYYDRYLNNISHSTKMLGIGFSVQQSITLPTDSHDIRIPHIIFPF